MKPDGAVSTTKSNPVWSAACENTSVKKRSFLPSYSEKSPNPASDGDYFIGCDETTSITAECSENHPLDHRIAVSARPSRPILKYECTEDIPIDTRKRSWNKLPVPDIDKVKLTRAQSLQSFFTQPNSNDIPPRMKKVDSTVTFQMVTIREFNQTIGDNPSVSYGTPISLGWDFDDCEPLDLDTYEALRGPRRTHRQMILSHYQRKNLLQFSGHSSEEVKQAKQKTNKAKYQREFSNCMQKISLLEEVVESAIRKTKRRFEKKP